MKKRDLILFFGLEIFAIVLAVAAFSMLDNKILAGGLAGGYFLLSGIFMLARANQWPRKWMSLTWYVLLVNVFVITLPMLVSRFLHTDLAFEDVRILGVPAPVFHKISSVVFSVLMVSTVIDWLRVAWATRVQPIAKN